MSDVRCQKHNRQTGDKVQEAVRITRKWEEHSVEVQTQLARHPVLDGSSIVCERPVLGQTPQNQDTGQRWALIGEALALGVRS